MPTYLVEIEPANTLDGISNMVRNEELSFAEFDHSTIGTYKGIVTNLVEFNDLAATATVPPIAVFVKTSDPPPAGKNKKWSGPMIVAGNTIDVALYR